MTNLKTIVLAAGKGVRMKSDLPKVLHKVCGKPILQYILDLAKDVGSLKTYVVLGHKSDVVKEFLGKEAIGVLQKKLLGTADAIKTVSNYFRGDKGDVLILSGDTPLLNPETIKKLIAKHRRSKAICTFLTAVVNNPEGYGRVIRDGKNMAIAIREEKDANDDERLIKEINVGVYCFQSRLLFDAVKTIKLNEKKKEFYLTDIVAILSQGNHLVETVQTADAKEGLGVNTREDLAAAESVLRQKILKNFMLNGVTIVDPQTTYIDADVVIGVDTTIRPFTVIENNVRIGQRCLMGPFCRIRPGSIIADDVEIGNFTEVSRSKLGNKSLMKHFSFLGDAVLGRNVNIGAGVVTANFDGKQKNKTRIDDGAFIGSDSILVAPVQIGKKSITAAGCVVTKGKKVPDGFLALGVPAKIFSRKKT